MPRRDPVGVIRQPSRYGSGANDILEFICCVGGQQPQIHKLWSFSEDEITREVHARATGRRVRDAFLREHRLERAQNALYIHNIGVNERVNRSDDDWYDLWDERADQ